MSQKTQQLKQSPKIVFEKETTLRDILMSYLKNKGIDKSKFDLYSRKVNFSVDGVIPFKIGMNGKPTKLSTAEVLDMVVKPSQEVKILPAVAGG